MLFALHNMANNQTNLTFILTDALDMTFFKVMRRLITALVDLWRNGDLTKHAQQETDTLQGADLPKSVWKSLIFGSDVTNTGNDFLETAGASDVTLKEDLFSSALKNTVSTF